MEENVKGLGPDRFQDDPILAGIVHRLVEAFQPERIYLFGSKARSDESKDSDYVITFTTSWTNLMLRTSWKNAL